MARKKSESTFNGTNDTPVEIRHPDTGFEFGVTYKTFTEAYEPEGYELMRRADGQPLTKGDAEAAEKAAEEATAEPEAPQENTADTEGE